MAEVVSTDRAPKAVGAYSQAVKTGNLIFVSGQIPIVPETGEFVSGGAGNQTRRNLLNIKAVLEEAGSSLAQVVKCTVMLTDMNDFTEMNSVYQEFFPSNPPARAAFSVKGLPKGALVEIEAIAEISPSIQYEKK